MRNIEKEIILDEENPIFSGTVEDGEFSIPQSSYLDTYMLLCSKALNSVTSSLNKARLSLSMIDAVILDGIAKDQEAKGKYIELLVENSIIRVQSIYDRALILTNRILNIGLSNECISHNALVTNDHVIRFSLKDKLKALNKACSDYRLARNTVIHHDRYTEAQLDQLTMLISADALSKETGGKEIVDEATLNFLTTNYLTFKQKEITGYLDNIEDNLNELFEELIKVYHYQKELLRESKT